jgi:hypothetical protein
VIVPFVPPPLEAGCLAHAIALVRSGFQLVLLHGIIGADCTCGSVSCSKGKHPIQNAWQKHTLREENQVYDAFRRCRVKEPNLGIVLGVQPFGAYVLAIDVDDVDRMVALEAELGQLPATLHGQSARGARLFYTIADPPKDLENRRALGGEPGVDVKVRGGQVVVAPSLHYTGVRYTWVATPDKLAELPAAWLHKIVERHQATATVTPITASPGYRSASKTERSVRERAQAYLNTCDPSISGQGGHDRAMRAATVLVRGFALDKQTAFSMMVNGFNSRCQPPWSLKEIEHKIDEALRVGDMEFGELRDMPMPAKSKSNGAAPAPPPVVQVVESAPGIQLTMFDGAPAKIAENVATMLLKHEAWKGGPKLDQFGIVHQWSSIDLLPPRKSLEIENTDDVAVQGWLLRQPFLLRVKVGLDIVHAGVEYASKMQAYDSLVRHVEAFPKWDGTSRIDRWLTTHLGAPDTIVNRRIARIWLVASIARAMCGDAGCLVDWLPVLEGPQGVGKTRAVRVLYGEDWVKGFGHYVIGKDVEVYDLAGSCWCGEIDEHLSAGRASAEALKTFLSTTHDVYRPKYGRRSVRRARRAFFVSTTNLSQYLDDEENRRVLPIKVGTIDIERLQADREQLWAEARAAYLAGESWWGLTAQEKVALVDIQDERRVEDPFAHAVVNTVAGQKQVLVAWVLDQCGVAPKDRDQRMEKRVGAALRRNGWHRRKVRDPATGRTVWMYCSFPDDGEHGEQEPKTGIFPTDPMNGEQENQNKFKF